MNKHFVIDPNGQKHTRNSKSRRYTHAVLVRECEIWALEQARKFGAWKVHASNWKYDCEKAAQGDAHPHAAYMSEEQWVESRRVAALTLEEYRQEQTDFAIAHWEKRKAAGEFKEYGVVGWCGRPDLAQKLHFQQDTARYADIITLEAEVL